MKKYWNQPLEVKALIISLTLTTLGFLGTAFLFWFQRYDVPLAILASGIIMSLTWLFLYLSKKSDKKHVKLDIILIYLRLTLVVGLAILFTVLQLTLGLVIISPIYLIIAYAVISLFTLIAYFMKGENDV